MSESEEEDMDREEPEYGSDDEIDEDERSDLEDLEAEARAMELMEK